ncbi:tripartite tricarboxylate transporter substrate binding protein [Variovorax gossypii]|uniref:Tripartite tricarboxylate transporter substrate binding protein n=1 Tax=Variovorax gossypii TaxID=1679495 RepID=A0A431TJE4_9BURK|nr:tripartite tricarboxylate transporter substrate binding protein [Variovorax gossypii]RTQ32973.1 tripartite tricarboxylate transporter substrate binding protein [Variovorax gossypii]
MNRRTILEAGFLVIASQFFGLAYAQDAFPSKPIRIIVPFVPGSAPDVFARVVADRMTTVVGKPLIVENRPGATGIIGTEIVAHAPADGYTLLVASPSTTILAASNRKLSFNPTKDLQPVSMGAYMVPVLVTGAGSPIKDVATLIEMAKARPGKLVIASGGVGNSQHLAAEMLKQMAGIELLHVPFQGTPLIVPSLIRGEVDLTFADASALPLIKAGKIRAIAVGSPARSKALPDVPTVAESGLPGFSYQSWFGIMAAAPTPAPVAAFLNRALNQTLRDPEVQAKLFTAGLEAAPGTPEAMSAFITDDIKRWSKVIQTANIKFD